MRALAMVAAMALAAVGTVPGVRGNVEDPGFRRSADRRVQADTTPTREVDLGRHFAGSEPIEATVVLLDDVTGAITRHDPDRARTRFRPASTFKIPNTIIALETGVADGAEFTLPWDSALARGRNFFPSSWRGPQSLRSAFRNSVYWYYQELARRIGPDRMRRWLERLDYGNRSIAGGIDRFWLSGGLAISADEQVRFLRRLRGGELGVSAPSLAILDQVSLLETTDRYRLHGKTGTSAVTSTRENGWIVGWVEVDGRTTYYAINMEGESVWEDWPPDDRLVLVQGILTEQGVIPP